MSIVAEFPVWLVNTAYATNRWFHLVAGTLMVGGVLFFAFVIPRATADLKSDQQFAVFGYARWLFRKIVVWSVLTIILTGVISYRRMWFIYGFDQTLAQGFWAKPTTWAYAHIIFAVVGLVILIRVTATRNILDNPVRWLWAILVFLLVGMLMASVARQMRLVIDDRLKAENASIASR